MNRILTIQDVSCVGKCSLTVALPIISAFGVEAGVLPTAVLSTHTAFSSFTFRDLTDDMVEIANEWKKQNISFNALYTGYLGSFKQLVIYMNDSTIDWAHIQNQALSVERLDSANYNQVTGKEMKAFFKGKEMRQVDVIGSVRLVYYPMEKDSTFIGMNISETSQLSMFLENRKLKKMIMSPKSNGTLYPMTQIPSNKKKLDNFAWFDYVRPLSKEDIFNWRGKGAGQELKKSTRGAAPLPNQKLFENNKKE